MTRLEAFWTLRAAAAAGTGAVYNADERKLTGEIPLDQETKEALRFMVDEGEAEPPTVSGLHVLSAELPLTGFAKTSVSAPAGFFETAAELVARRPFDAPPEIRIFHPEDESKYLKKYRDAVRLGALLSQIASSRDDDSWTILANSRLKILKTYSLHDLCDVSEINEMAGKIAPAPDLNHRDSRMRDVYEALFVQAVRDVLAFTPAERRFAFLLGHFQECLFRFHLSFKCFSEEAVGAVKRFEDSRTAMVTALNGVLGNIQTALIGIPLSGLLALKEMRPGGGWLYENAVIASAVLIVGVLLLILSFSQGRTLKAIEDQRSELAGELDIAGGENTKLAKSVKNLQTHCVLVRNLLYAVRILILSFMVVPVWAWCGRTSAPPPSADTPDKAQSEDRAS